MDILAELIQIGKRRPQTIRDVLEELNDPELPESRFWQIMSYLQNAAGQAHNDDLLRLLDKVKMLRTGNPFPRFTVTTPQNLPSQRVMADEDEMPNLNAPRINLQRMLEKPWFAAVCTDKKKYDSEWIAQFVGSLMAEHGLLLAREWKARPDVVRGQVAGALREAGVIKGSMLSIAREYYGVVENTKDAKTFANYMGRQKDAPYLDFVLKYLQEKE